MPQINIPGFLWPSVDHSFAGSFPFKAGRTGYFLFEPVSFICGDDYSQFNSRYVAQRHWRISYNTTHLRRMNFPCWQMDLYFMFLWQTVRSKTESRSTATSVEESKRFYLKPLLFTRILTSFPMCCIWSVGFWVKMGDFPGNFNLSNVLVFSSSEGTLQDKVKLVHVFLGCFLLKEKGLWK